MDIPCRNGEVDDLIQENEPATTKETGKKSKKGKKKGGDWEDDVAKDLEDMTLEEEGGVKPEEPPQETPRDKKKKEKVRYNVLSVFHVKNNIQQASYFKCLKC